VEVAPSVFKFECEACGQRIASSRDQCGAIATCPACRVQLRVPDPEPEVEQAPGQVFKFHCEGCGQRVSATSDQFGTTANCPTCGLALTVAAPSPPIPAPPPAAPAEEVLSPEEMQARTRALGCQLAIPEEAFTLMGFQKRPTAEQLREIGSRMFVKMLMDGKGFSVEETRAMILEVAPELGA
jgi:predicted RNA-binding Zn-ribbon protein involved in translation (DUF1610 family)